MSIYQKAKNDLIRYCNYQERCMLEVQYKLNQYSNLTEQEQNELVATLQAANLLNEIRYASSFVRSHFYTKKWGKIKITHALKLKEIAEKTIQDALLQISYEDYYNTLFHLLRKKRNTLAEERNNLITQKKLMNYALQKGYEIELIKSILYNNTL